MHLHLQQTTFENIMTKGEIAHDEQFHFLPQCIQLYYMIKHYNFVIEFFHNFASMLTKSSAAYLLYVAMG